MKTTVKIKCAILLLMSAVFITSASADEKSKSAKLNELMELSGMVDIMEQAQNKNKTQALHYKQVLMKQIRAGLKTDDPEVGEYFETEYQKFVDSLKPKWTVEEAVQKYIDLYGARMTEEEIDKVLEFEKSAVGRKSTSVSNEVVPVWMDYLSKESDAQFNEGLQKFVANMKAFIAEKKNQKKHTEQ